LSSARESFLPAEEGEPAAVLVSPGIDSDTIERFDYALSGIRVDDEEIFLFFFETEADVFGDQSAVCLVCLIDTAQMIANVEFSDALKNGAHHDFL